MSRHNFERMQSHASEEEVQRVDRVLKREMEEKRLRGIVQHKQDNAYARAVRTDAPHPEDSSVRAAYLRWTFWLTLALFMAYTAAASVLFNEYTTTSWTTHYWLEGDDSLNGDANSNINVPFWAGITGICVLLISLVGGYGGRAHFNLDHDHKWSRTTNNLVIWGPISLANALLTAAFIQCTGSSNVWVIIYGLVHSFAADWLGCSMRVVWLPVGNPSVLKRFGSGWIALMMYLCLRSSIIIYLAICAARNGLSTNVTAAFWVFFSFSVIQTCLIAGAYFWAFVNPEHGFVHAKFVLQPLASYTELPATDTNNSYRDAVVKVITTKRLRITWSVVAVLTMAATIVFTVGTNVFARRVYERITWTLTKPNENGMTFNVEFDRVWGVLQVALPLQFGLPFLVSMIQLFWVKYYQGMIAKASDTLNDTAFGIADFWVAWATLNYTGTTEFPELFFGSLLVFCCTLLLTEARREYPWYFTLVPTAALLLPFIHAVINVKCLDNRSNQELILSVITLVLYGLRQFFFFALRYKPSKKPGVYFTAAEAHKYVFWRYIFNFCMRFILVAVWLSNAFHHGDDIQNNK